MEREHCPEPEPEPEPQRGRDEDLERNPPRPERGADCPDRLLEMMSDVRALVEEMRPMVERERQRDIDRELQQQQQRQQLTQQRIARAREARRIAEYYEALPTPEERQAAMIARAEWRRAARPA